MKAGESFTITVRGEPNTTFNWTGFDSSGTTATDSNGVCVFPALIAPQLSGFQKRLYAFALGSASDFYPLTVNWPDGIVTKFTLEVSEA